MVPVDGEAMGRDTPRPGRDGRRGAHSVKLSFGNWIALVGLCFVIVSGLLGAMTQLFQLKSEAEIASLKAKLVQKDVKARLNAHDKADLVQDVMLADIKRQQHAVGRVVLNVKSSVDVLVRDAGIRPKPLPRDLDVSAIIGSP